MRPLVIVSAILLILATPACDDSDAELSRTQQIVQRLTNERDDLKAQVGRSEAKLAELQQQIDILRRSAATAGAARGEPTSTTGTRSGSKRTSRPGSAEKAKRR
jgi:peptidoglycan hydrolase CwlO-like protein